MFAIILMLLIVQMFMFMILCWICSFIDCVTVDTRVVEYDLCTSNSCEKDRTQISLFSPVILSNFTSSPVNDSVIPYCLLILWAMLQENPTH